MKYKKEAELRGKKRSVILNYFENLPGVKCDLNTVQGYDWDVVIGEESIYKLGNMEFPEVKIVITGNKESVENVYNTFRIEFLSAGG